MSFFAELRRRKVYKVGTAYAVAAWVLLQIADVVVPALSLPQRATSLILLVLLLGFPIAVFLAWAYELTPDGVRRTRSATEGELSGSATLKYEFAFILFLVVAIGLIVYDRFYSVADISEIAQESRTESVDIADSRSEKVSIAVLPFLNLSDVAEQEHFADGLTEELLNSLTTTDGLRVISRTSSFAFKGSALPVTDIAAQLKVGYILEGSVRRSGDTIRVTAQLIDAVSDAHLWSRNYEEVVDADNVFKLQESIASLVTDSLQLRLTPRNAPKAPASIEALDLYYDGLFLFNELKNGFDLSDDIFERAAAKFNAALEVDPDWLPPFVKLGQLYHFWSFGGSDNEKFQTSRRYITEALQRDPENAEAHWSMGYILWVEGDFEGSLAAYGEADRLGGPQGWGTAITLTSLGRFDEAVAAYRSALQTYPVSLVVKAQLTQTMYCAGQYAEIIYDEDALVVSFDEDEEGVRYQIAQSHARLGNHEKALSYVDELAQLWGTEAYFADILAIVGKSERARRAIDELEERNRGLEAATTAALILGERDRAVNLLESRFEKRSAAGQTRFLFCAPEIRALRGEPRYDAILAVSGLL